MIVVIISVLLIIFFVLVLAPVTIYRLDFKEVIEYIWEEPIKAIPSYIFAFLLVMLSPLFIIYDIVDTWLLNKKIRKEKENE